MKRQLGNAPQPSPHLSIQNELALYKEIEDLKSTITTLRSHIALLTSAKHTLTHDNIQIVNEKSQLLSSVHTLEATLKREIERNSDLEVVNKSLIYKNDLLVKNNELLNQEKDATIKYQATLPSEVETQKFSKGKVICDELLDDISCQEDLFFQFVHTAQIDINEVSLSGDVS